VKPESFCPLDQALYREIVRQALAEDLRSGDVTTKAVVSSEKREIGEVFIKSPGVLAGIDIALEAFCQLDSDAELIQSREDGDWCEAGESVISIKGLASALLSAERTALNFLQRMSGTATLTRRFIDSAGSHVTVLDTRKTAPNLRVLDKYAVRAGGGVNHRFALDDGILIKDNHIRVAGSIANAIKRVREAVNDMPIEVEAQSLAEVKAAVAAGADIILVDNFETSTVQEAVRIVSGRAKIEVSGGITLESIAEFAATGVDFISVGALTHSAQAVDFSFEIRSTKTVLVDADGSSETV
jgi:nicotinate-nucleotide pyrophosphorylase (carboxylating)